MLSLDNLTVCNVAAGTIKLRWLLLAVSVNMALTVAGWVLIYDCQTDDKNSAFYLLDSRRNWTTGSDVTDGLANGFISILVLALVSFAVLGLVLSNCKRLVEAWLGFSCLLLLFGVSAQFLMDSWKKYIDDEPNYVNICAGTLIYGSLGAVAYFSRSSLLLHQSYVVVNCALSSLFYLRVFPAHTPWFVLGCIILWDCFAVLAPQGPLKVVLEKAQDYSDNVLKFVMFSAGEQRVEQEQEKEKEKEEKEGEEEQEEEGEVKDEEEQEEEESSGDRDTDVSTCESFSDHVAEATPTEATPIGPTAADALNDSSLRLGMGDFVFYSILVGKAACSGSIAATVAAAVGVILGVIVTLHIIAGEGHMPALPISVLLGTSFHFSTLLVFEPLIQHSGDVIRQLADAFIAG